MSGNSNCDSSTGALWADPNDQGVCVCEPWMGGAECQSSTETPTSYRVIWGVSNGVVLLGVLILALATWRDDARKRRLNEGLRYHRGVPRHVKILASAVTFTLITRVVLAVMGQSWTETSNGSWLRDNTSADPGWISLVMALKGFDESVCLGLLVIQAGSWNFIAVHQGRRDGSQSIFPFRTKLLLGFIALLWTARSVVLAPLWWGSSIGAWLALTGGVDAISIAIQCMLTAMIILTGLRARSTILNVLQQISSSTRGGGEGSHQATHSQRSIAGLNHSLIVLLSTQVASVIATCVQGFACGVPVGHQCSSGIRAGTGAVAGMVQLTALTVRTGWWTWVGLRRSSGTVAAFLPHLPWRTRTTPVEGFDTSEEPRPHAQPPRSQSSLHGPSTRRTWSPIIVMGNMRLKPGFTPPQGGLSMIGISPGASLSNFDDVAFVGAKPDPPAAKVMILDEDEGPKRPVPEAPLKALPSLTTGGSRPKPPLTIDRAWSSGSAESLKSSRSSKSARSSRSTLSARSSRSNVSASSSRSKLSRASRASMASIRSTLSRLSSRSRRSASYKAEPGVGAGEAGGAEGGVGGRAGIEAWLAELPPIDSPVMTGVDRGVQGGLSGGVRGVVPDPVTTTVDIGLALDGL